MTTRAAKKHGPSWTWGCTCAYNPIFAEFADELGDNLDSAIAMRERNRQRFPTDQNNIARLAILYASKMEREQDLGPKTVAINKGIELMQKLLEKRPDDLKTMDLCVLAVIVLEAGDQG